MGSMSKDTKQRDVEPTQLRPESTALDAGLFRSAFVDAATALGICGLDGRFLDVNAKFAALLGYPAAELCGRHFQDVTHPDDQADSLRTFEDLRARRSHAISLDKRYLKKDGHVVWVHLTVTLATTAAGDPH